MLRPRNVLWSFAAAAAALLITLAPHAAEAQESGPGEESGPGYVVDVTALDYAFAMPLQIPSGWVTFRMTNAGQEHHVMGLTRLPAGVTGEEFVRAVRTREMTAVRQAFQRAGNPPVNKDGGPGFLAPGKTGQTTIYLEPGMYVVGCGIKTPAGPTHATEGMMLPLTVTAERSGAPEPTADIQLTLSDYTIAVEGALTRGEHTVRVVFADTAAQDVHLVRLDEGVGIEEVVKYMDNIQNPAPAEFLGGAENMLQGDVAYFTVTLEPGRYGWITHEHADKGMLHEFTIH